MVPTPFRVKDNEIKYYNFCDDQGVGRVGFVDINDKFLPNFRVSKKPILDMAR